MSKLTVMVPAVVAFSAASAFAGVGVGEDAPDVKASAWFNLPAGLKKLTADHLKGQIVMVEFWATWCGPCRRGIPHLVEMQKKYRSKGVVLVALSEESKSIVEPYVKKHKIPYIVGAGASATTSAFGIQGYPTAFLIDPKGKVAWKGHPDVVEEEIKKLLKSSPPKTGGLLTEKSAAEALKKAEKLYKEKKYPDAMESLENIARSYKSTKTGKKAKALIDKMKANSSVMDAIARAKAEKQAEGWMEIARTLARYGEKKDAIKYYKKVIKDCAQTDHAKLARQELAALGDNKASDGAEGTDGDDAESGEESDASAEKGSKDDDSEDKESEEETPEEDEEDDEPKGG